MSQPGFLYFYALCLSFFRLGSCEQLDFKAENFFIKKDYISRSSYNHYDDRTLKDEYQDEVYFIASEMSKKYHFNSIGDVGCGSGYKLLKYFEPLATTGFEIEPTLTFLKSKYPARNWTESNFGDLRSNRQFDLMICADVIEHLENPDELLNWLANCTFEYLVISTPDRDQLIHFWTHPSHQAQLHSGPPVNSTHMREWNFEEFEKYLSRYFEVIQHIHCQKEFWGQIIIARKKIAKEAF